MCMPVFLGLCSVACLLSVFFIYIFNVYLSIFCGWGPGGASGDISMRFERVRVCVQCVCVCGCFSGDCV